MQKLYEMGLADNGTGNLYTSRSFIHGSGTFTSGKVITGTILCRRLGLKNSLSMRDKRAIIGIDGIDKAIPEDSIFKHINHSCEPNAIFTDTGCLTTLFNLSENIEITIDYTTLLLGSDWTCICTCGSDLCKQVIIHR